MLFLAGFIQTEAQTRREVQFSLDTLYKSHVKLQNDYQSVLEQYRQHESFFDHIKTTFLPTEARNTDVDKIQPIYDEILEKNRFLTQGLKDSILILTDSLQFYSDSLQFYTDSLQLLLDERDEHLNLSQTYKNLLLAKLNEGSFPLSENELIGTWNLFLNPMQVTSDSLKNGLVSHNPFTASDSLLQHYIYKIEFLPDELATMFFKDGRRQKCFYEVKNFSAKTPYRIVCSKQESFKLTIHISPMPSGLNISYEIPLDEKEKLYFFGLMKM
jgi:hypothetical protein